MSEQNVEKQQVDKKDLGLMGKFRVERVAPSGRGIDHDDCWYFVLDIKHDRMAREALLTYAKFAASSGYLKLADELIAKLEEVVNIQQEQPEGAELSRDVLAAIDHDNRGQHDWQGCTDCLRLMRDTTEPHVSTPTEHGPNFCPTCSAAVSEWVEWPCPIFKERTVEG